MVVCTAERVLAVRAIMTVSTRVPVQFVLFLCGEKSVSVSAVCSLYLVEQATVRFVLYSII